MYTKETQTEKSLLDKNKKEEKRLKLYFDSKEKLLESKVLSIQSSATVKKGNGYKNLIDSMNHKLERVNKIALQNRVNFESGEFVAVNQEADLNLYRNNFNNNDNLGYTRYTMNTNENYNLGYRYPLISKALGTQAPGLIEYCVDDNCLVDSTEKTNFNIKRSYSLRNKSDKYNSKYLNLRYRNTSTAVNSSCFDLQNRNSRLDSEYELDYCPICTDRSKDRKLSNEPRKKQSTSDSCRIAYLKFDNLLKNTNNYLFNANKENNFRNSEKLCSRCNAITAEEMSYSIKNANELDKDNLLNDYLDNNYSIKHEYQTKIVKKGSKNIDSSSNDSNECDNII